MYVLGRKKNGVENALEWAGMARNKRPRVLGDHPRHFLGTLGRPERLGTVWNGTLALRDASVGGQQAGDIEIRPRGRLEKIEIKNFENTKNEILIFSNMLFVRYPWKMWGLGNVSKRSGRKILSGTVWRRFRVPRDNVRSTYLKISTFYFS